MSHRSVVLVLVLTLTAGMPIIHMIVLICFFIVFLNLWLLVIHVFGYQAASVKYKWPAVAAKAVRSRYKVGLLSIQYAYYFRAYQRQWNGR